MSEVKKETVKVIDTEKDSGKCIIGIVGWGSNLHVLRVLEAIRNGELK
jgi:hypothetical protein